MTHKATTPGIPLCVPPWDESAALRSGARYDKYFGFYLPNTESTDNVYEWLPLRWKRSPALVPEMLPVTAWAQNVRTATTKEQWDRYRRYSYKAAGYRCEICGAGGKTQLECHERWQFLTRDGVRIQKLVGLISLCPLCHKAHHLGFANTAGVLPQVLYHICLVNEWSAEQLDAALIDLETSWKRDSKHKWQLDLEWLQTSGYVHA